MRAAIQRPFAAATSKQFPELAPLRHVPVSTSDPTPRQRLVKDICSIGLWHPAGHKPWSVTHQTLIDLAHNFTRMIRNGNRVNMVWGHGDSGQIGVDARSIISPIDQVFVHGDSLYATTYVVPGSIDLSHQVSIRALQNHHDGAGNVYPWALLHVALVDHPIVTGQQPFLDMANSPSKPKGAAMADDPKPDEAAADTETETEGEAADSGAPALTDIIQQAFGMLNIVYPEDVPDSALPYVLKALLDSAAGGDPEEDEGEGKPAAPLTDSGAVDGGGTTDPANPYNMGAGKGKPRDLASMVKVVVASATKGLLVQQQRAIDLAIAPLVSEKLAATKSAYEKHLESLLKGGLPPARKQHFIDLGAKHAYDLALLPAVGDFKPIDMGRTAKHAATAEPPKLATVSVGEEETEEDIKAGRAAFGRV